MIEWAQSQPEFAVPDAEYLRLLGYPRHVVLEGRARELADGARDWYAAHGRPWIYVRQAADWQIDGESVNLAGAQFHSPRLRRMLDEGRADRAMLVAVSAGPELEQEAQRLWRDDRPDEYFFLEVFGSAVVEQLVTATGARLCDWAEADGAAVLPHDSPGYPDWDVAEQPRLLHVINQSRRDALPGPLDVLDSGMLRPKKSMLAVFGVTRQTESVRRLTDFVPCDQCSRASCQYRRVAYERPPGFFSREVAAASHKETPAAEPPAAPLDVAAPYAVNRKALARWAAERLSLRRRADGGVDAKFRYDGTTCSNMGSPLAFDYTVALGPREEGYPIRDERCMPAPQDVGHSLMCAYLDDAKSLMRAIDGETHLVGRRLDDVLAWPRPSAAAACYCDPASRVHKWGLVLETVHFALAQEERSRGLRAAPRQEPAR